MYTEVTTTFALLVTNPLPIYFRVPVGTRACTPRMNPSSGKVGPRQVPGSSLMFVSLASDVANAQVNFLRADVERVRS